MENEYIQKAIEIVKNGGVIIYPTDTAFGIGCRIDNNEAVERLFKIRKRPESKAVPMLVSSIDMAREYFDSVSPEVMMLMNTYWPGALTIVYWVNEGKVNLKVRGNQTTIGIRMPDHLAALSLIRGVGVPIAGPSANFHGEDTPYIYKDLDSELVKLVDYVIPGKCSVQQSSTVVDCTKTPIQIIRQGIIHI